MVTPAGDRLPMNAHDGLPLDPRRPRAGFFAIGAVFGLGLYIAFELPALAGAGAALPALDLRAPCLFWFNVEVWGRVIWTIWRWGKRARVGSQAEEAGDLGQPASRSR